MVRTRRVCLESVDLEGWVVACTDDEVPPGEMLRFDVGPRTFVVYHAEVSSLPLR